MTAVLTIRGLSWTPPRSPGADESAAVLRGIDLDVEAGEFVALEGPSGSGKTVLGTSALRLRPPPRQGRILWGERDVTRLGTRALRPLRRGFQGMLQHTGALLPPFMTLRQALHETLAHVRGGSSDGSELDDVAATLDLEGLLDRYPRFLSGGEQRRASIARLLLTQPSFAFVDEPDAGLDPPSQLEVMDCIRRLVDQTGAGVLLITHSVGLAATFADRRLRLAAGVLHEV